MATFLKTDHPGRTVMHTWTLTTADATGNSVSYPGASDRTIQFTGTFGSATVILEGSLDGSTFFTLTDGPGNDISFTAAGGEMVAENVLHYRVRLSTGGSGASIVCRLFSRSTMR